MTLRDETRIPPAWESMRDRSSSISCLLGQHKDWDTKILLGISTAAACDSITRRGVLLGSCGVWNVAFGRLGDELSVGCAAATPPDHRRDTNRLLFSCGRRPCHTGIATHVACDTRGCGVPGSIGTSCTSNAKRRRQDVTGATMAVGICTTADEEHPGASARRPSCIFGARHHPIHLSHQKVLIDLASRPL